MSSRLVALVAVGGCLFGAACSGSGDPEVGVSDGVAPRPVRSGFEQRLEKALLGEFRGAVAPSGVYPRVDPLVGRAVPQGVERSCVKWVHGMRMAAEFAGESGSVSSVALRGRDGLTVSETVLAVPGERAERVMGGPVARDCRETRGADGRKARVRGLVVPRVGEAAWAYAVEDAQGLAPTEWGEVFRFKGYVVEVRLVAETGRAQVGVRDLEQVAAKAYVTALAAFS